MISTRRLETEPDSSPCLPPVRGIFMQRVAGDDALLRLAAMRFAQAGMPAELYAETPDEAERLLRYVPPHGTRPTVHLDRTVDLLEPDGQASVLAFASRLGNRVSGLVVHDQPRMLDRVPALIEALHNVADRADGPCVFLEYSVGAPLDWFVDVAGRAAAIERAGVCVDIGHVGLTHVNRRLRSIFPEAWPLTPYDPSFASAVMQMQQITREALPTVLALVAELGACRSTVHFHLHDGHPAVPGLADHFSFLMRLPVPFEVDGARSLPPMYGPPGLASILASAVCAVPPQRLSLTLEVHQAEGRLPLDPRAAELFTHWSDITNAERFNYWLSVIQLNHTLATTALTPPMH
jgi:hypothetical protein